MTRVGRYIEGDVGFGQPPRRLLSLQGFFSSSHCAVPRSARGNGMRVIA